MNVLMVDQFGETGGAQKCLLDLIAGWPDGDGVVVAAPAGGTLLRSVRERGYPTAEISCGPYAMGRKSAADAIQFCADVLGQRATVRRLIRQYRIDVVYVNGPRVLAGAVLGARKHCPVVFHMHNRLHGQFEIAIVRLALRCRASTAIACCEHVAASLPKARPTVVPNGVPDVGFRARRYPPEGPWRIGMVGRISPEKGHLVLLDAVRLLAAEGHRIAVTVAGASLFSSDEYEMEVRKRTAGLDVRFTGWIEDVGEALGEFDLLAVPSIAEPGLPRVVLEAFSAGVPVVALPSGGIPEAVQDGVTGFLSAGFTSAALAARLRDAMQRPAEDLTRVVQNARAEWEVRWNVDRWRCEVIDAIRATAMAPEQRNELPGASAAANADRPARPA